MLVVSGTEMKKIEEYAINTIKLPSVTLMERAALSLCNFLMENYSDDKKILVVAGVGNNGADGIAVARMLKVAGRKVAVYIIGDESKSTPEFALQKEIYDNLDGEYVSMWEEFDAYDVIVDGIFGIGLKREITGKYREIIECINNLQREVVSIDVPSGVDSDTGNIMGIAVKANHTITFSNAKIGLLLAPGNTYAGRVSIANIGIPSIAYEGNCNTITYMDKTELSMPGRDANGNKGTFGKILIIAGSMNMSGAAYLCAKAAYRMGSGLVKIVTCNENREVLQKMLPEAILFTYNGLENIDISNEINWADSIVIGPGIGKSQSAVSLVEQVLNSDKKIVIDADGLNIISEHIYLKDKLNNNVIITPHIGEMARLTMKSIYEVKNNIISIAEEFANKYNITVVLKDARTVVACGVTGKKYINTSGNDGMATAGSGDVLAGIMGSLYARDNSAFNSAINAVYLHGVAGDIAATRLGNAGVMASDIAESVNETLL